MSLVTPFKNPKKSLTALDPEAAASLIAAASDVALIIGGDGVIRDVTFQSDDLSRELRDPDHWVGQSWADIATPESKTKISALLRAATTDTAPKWRHINHPSPHGRDVPILYSTAQAGEDGPIIAFGRDLRAVSVLQQRMLDAQQSMERDYSRLQHLEMRYRLLFQMSAEAVVVLDAATARIVEANPAAQRIFGPLTGPGGKSSFADGFDAHSIPAIELMMSRLHDTGRAEDIELSLANGKGEMKVSGALFRQDNTSLYLIRLAPPDGEHHAAASHTTKSKLLKVVESAPDGFVLATAEGRILMANAAFIDMAQLTSQNQVEGELLDRWLGRFGADLNVLMANLAQRGSIRLYPTVLRTDYGPSIEVEVSAVAVRNGGQPCFGFVIRNIDRRLNAEPVTSRALMRPVEQLTELIGRMSLKDLVQDATTLIERLCIEAALEMTGDNRASAAELLGLSRQSLYQKLRRYGLGNLATEGDS